MNFQSRASRRRETEINMIPLIDLFMTVLVFFILATTFSRDTVFFVDLPDAKDAQASTGENQIIEIAVSSEGQIALNNRKAELSGLKSYLVELKKSSKKDIPVVIRADEKVNHGKVVEVIDAVQGSGFSNLGIVTQQKK